jgi:hypothetical protein
MSDERDDQRDVVDPVDALIDEAARSLMQAEPPVSLRVRVRSSIETVSRDRAWAWQPALAGAAFVAIAMVAMWQLPFTRKPVVPPSIPQRVERAPEVPSAVPRVEPQQMSRDGAAGAPIERAARRGPEPPPQAASVVSRGPVVPGAELLPPIEPIAFEPVESSAMAAIERMPAPMPVEIERLAIEQLFE